MYSVILQTILFSSLAVVVYLLARVIPRVEDAQTEIHKRDRLDHLLKILPVGRMDARINELFERWLRRVKVMLLRSDNIVDRRLKRIRNIKNENGLREQDTDLFKRLGDGTKE